jgi:hypothetical protein
MIPVSSLARRGFRYDIAPGVDHRYLGVDPRSDQASSMDQARLGRNGEAGERLRRRFRAESSADIMALKKSHRGRLA